MKPPNKAEKEFIAQCNRVRALISFHKIKTLGEAAKELGLAWLVDTDGPITPTGFNEWLKSIEEKRHGTPPEPLAVVAPPKQEILVAEIVHPDSDKGQKKRYSAQDKYGHLVPPKRKEQKAECLYFQRDCALEVFNAITVDDKRGVYVRANTGDGKTYFAAQLTEWLINSGFIDKISVSPWKILYVTGASIVEQTEEVLREFGLNIPEDIEVTNYESLRAKFGRSKCIKKTIVVEDGEEFEIWEWDKLLHPGLIIWDEAHKLKNDGSTQSKIAQACNNLSYINPFTKEEVCVYQVFMSASPFSRVAHAKAFAVATRKEWTTRDGRKIQITNANWSSIASAICQPDDLLTYSRPAIKKFLREFKHYIFPFKNVRRKFKGILKTRFIDFLTDEDAKEYKECWDKFLEFKKSVEGKEYSQSRFLLLVQLNVFRQAAEKLRKRHLAMFVHEKIQAGYAPVIACAFKSTIALTIKLLIDEYGYSRDDFSIIWGGSAAFGGTGKNAEPLTKEELHKFFSDSIKHPDLVDPKMLKRVHAQLQAEHDGLKNIDKSLRLGIQTREARNEERKAFQSGQTKGCFFTYGAGKEGLSLHQNQPFLKPRWQFNTPVYNEMEMLQAEGRTARITSLSDTIIETCVFRNTIEVPVLHRVLAKRECLEVVRTHGDRLEAMDTQVQELMKLAGLETGRDEDEDLEEEVFAELEQEIEKESEEEV